MKIHILVFCAGLSLAGCGTLHRPFSAMNGVSPLQKADDRPSHVNVVGYLNSYTDMPKVNADASFPASSFDGALAAFEQYPKISTVKNEARNNLVRLLIARSDSNCELYVSAIRSSRVATRGALTLGSLALTSAATITTPERSKDVLTTVSAFLQGTNTTFTNEVFSQLGATAIYNSILAQRQARLAQITRNLGEPYDRYPIVTGINDAQNYHALCSIRAAEAATNTELFRAKEANARVNEEAISEAEKAGRQVSPGAKPAVRPTDPPE